MKPGIVFISLFFSFIGMQAQQADSLVAHYPFNGNAIEELGTGIDGVVNGAMLTTDRFNHTDSAYLFISDYPSYIDLDDSFDEIFTVPDAQFSISFWIYPNDNMLNKAIFSKYGNSNCGQNGREFLIRVNNDSKIEWIYYRYLHTTNTRQGVQGSTPILQNSSWVHIVISYNGPIPSSQGLNRIKLYVNGVQELSSYTTNVGTLELMENGASHLGIGLPLDSAGLQCGDFAFDGKIDDIKLFDKVLSQAEIDTLFNEPDPIIPILSTNELESESTYLFPNPVCDELNLSNARVVTVKIFDLAGHEVLSSKQLAPYASLNLAFLTEGFYLLKLFNGSITKTLRFCKISN